MFERFLVPLDGSSLAECVLPHVVAMARADQPEVQLLRVLDPVGAATRPRSVDPFDWQLRKAEAESYLKDIASRLEGQGLVIKQEALEGNAAEATVDYANSHNVDLILLSSHGQSGISGWNVSSVVQKVILRAQTSVMLVRAYQPVTEDLSALRYKRILVPLDGSQRAECVLSPAAALARSNEAEILLAHVVKQPEMPRRTPLSQEDKELVEQVTERNRLEAERYLAELKGRINASVSTQLLIHANVTAALHQLVEQDEVDLVMLAAHGYSGGTKWPYGTTVISFIAYGTTPLLVIQDLPKDRMEPSRAEMAAREQGGR